MLRESPEHYAWGLIENRYELFSVKINPIRLDCFLYLANTIISQLLVRDIDQTLALPWLCRN